MTDRRSGARRKHAAEGGRILALGLSASAAITLAATMANAAPHSAGSAVLAQPEPIVVHVVVPASRPAAAQPAPVATPSPLATPQAVAPPPPAVPATPAPPPTLAAAPPATPATAQSRAS